MAEGLNISSFLEKNGLERVEAETTTKADILNSVDEESKSTDESKEESTTEETKDEKQVESKDTTTEESKTETTTEEDKTEESESETKAEDTTKEETTSETAVEDKTEETKEESSLDTEQELETFTSFGEWEDSYNSGLDEGEPTFSELMAIKYENLDAKDETDIIVEAMLVKDSETTDQEIDATLAEFEPLFWTDEERENALEDGEIKQRELDSLNARFEKLKRTSLNELKNIQNAIDLSDIPMYRQQQQQDNTADTEEQVKLVTQAVDNYLSNYNNETFKVVDEKGNDLFEIDFKVSNTLKGQLRNIASDPNNVYGRWINEDGTMDMNSYMRDMTYLEGRNEILKSVHNQAKSEGGAEVAKDISNITHEKTDSASTGAKNQIPSMHDNWVAMQRGELRN